MAEYDLTHAMSPFLDRHLVLPLVDFQLQRNLYKQEDVLRAKLELLSGTCMSDLEREVYNELNPDQEDEDLARRRADVLQRYNQIQHDLDPVIELFENEDALAEISKNSNRPDALRASLQPYGFKDEMISTLETCAKLYYQIGQYEEAATFLYNFRVLSTDADKNFSALWGKLAADILSEKWVEADADLSLLIEYIDGRNNLTPVKQLQQRAWVLHWSLFVYFNRADGPEKLIELFLKKREYSNAIQTVCPHLLRYVTALVIIHQRQQRGTLKDLAMTLRQEAQHYSDPITRFFLSLYDEFDFDKAQHHLKECEVLLENDSFLESIGDDFLQNARSLIFEMYCRIHSTVSIPMLAEKLGMAEDKAEEWIVNLIRNSNMEAKIDSAAGQVVMDSQIPSIYLQVLEKTKNLSFRTRLINDHLDKRGGGKRGGDRRERHQGANAPVLE